MIKILKKHVAEKIAAGEVVDRPVSVVKELLENAIDAEADNITVEIKKGGKTYIRVTDNGCGISDNEVEIAFLRHATSKISEVDDLNSLITLGFRGEALASITAVSRVEMITKTADEKAGTKIFVQGGEVIEKAHTGAPDGTTIVVRDLFYNTPAREKFLKSDGAESSLIDRLVIDFALAYTNVKVKLINNGKILFSTKGNNNRLDTIKALTGGEQIKSLIPVKLGKDGLEISGYISAPGESKASKKSQVYFVNGRVVNSKIMEKSVKAAYSDRLFSGRYPIVYLFLQVDPKIVDVNIHPTKREVRFHDDNEIFQFIKEALVEALAVKDAIPEISTEETAFDISDFESGNRDGFVDKQVTTIQHTKQNRSRNNTYNKNISHEKRSTPEEEQLNVASILDEYKKAKNPVADKISEETTYNSFTNDNGANDKPILATSVFDDLEILGVAFGTYIMGTANDEIYLIDQHAAHERVQFEKILQSIENHNIKSQIMMSPITIDGTITDDKWAKPLIDMGYAVENFGPATWLIKEIPAFLDEQGAKELAQEYLDLFDSSDMNEIINNPLRSSGLMENAASKACKSAVKANDMLSSKEIKRLIDDLSKCNNPLSCPHGRPTFIKLSKSEIEKKFKRK